MRIEILQFSARDGHNSLRDLIERTLSKLVRNVRAPVPCSDGYEGSKKDIHRSTVASEKTSSLIQNPLRYITSYSITWLADKQPISTKI